MFQYENWTKSRFWRGLLLMNFLNLTIGAGLAAAQSWPTRTVRIVSFFVAGSPADALARMVAQKVSESVGQPVVVDVQAGAGGLLAAQTVARSQPDGHTLLVTISTTLTTTPHLVKDNQLGLKDFQPIIIMAKAATCMVGATNFKPNNAKEMIDFVKANPGKVAYGSNGVGGTYHLEMEMLKAKHNLDIIHVPYKGGTDGLAASAAGTIPISFAPCSSVTPLARAGKVKYLAVLEMKKSPEFPDIPAMGELIPDYEKINGGTDVWAPAATPNAVVQKIRDEIDRALALPDVRKRMSEIGFPYSGISREAMLAERSKDFETSGRAVKIAGLKPE